MLQNVIYFKISLDSFKNHINSHGKKIGLLWWFPIVSYELWFMTSCERGGGVQLGKIHLVILKVVYIQFLQQTFRILAQLKFHISFSLTNLCGKVYVRKRNRFWVSNSLVSWLFFRTYSLVKVVNRRWYFFFF